MTKSNKTSQPDQAFAEQISKDFCNEKILKIKRFSTGNCHYVFDVVSENQNFVVRIAKPENKSLLEGAIFWNSLLKPKGVPLPQILASDLDAEFPYIILERLKGRDLWMVYGELSAVEKKCLAQQMAEFQAIAGTLPKARSFGYLETYESKAGCDSWLGLVEKMLQRSRDRIAEVGVFDVEIVDRIESKLPTYQSYFSKIEAIPYFHDITTKNVLIYEGKLSGIVDVDSMCFGDNVQTIGLTKMALLQDDHKFDYIGYWCDEMNLNVEQRKVLNFYTAGSCVDFISEIGQTFNQSPNLPIDFKRAEKLHKIFEDLIKTI